MASNKVYASYFYSLRDNDLSDLSMQVCAVAKSTISKDFAPMVQIVQSGIVQNVAALAKCKDFAKLQTAVDTYNAAIMAIVPACKVSIVDLDTSNLRTVGITISGKKSIKTVAEIATVKEIVFPIPQTKDRELPTADDLIAALETVANVDSTLLPAVASMIIKMHTADNTPARVFAIDREYLGKDNKPARAMSIVATDLQGLAQRVSCCNSVSNLRDTLRELSKDLKDADDPIMIGAEDSKAQS